jgi:hypothetical protein
MTDVAWKLPIEPAKKRLKGHGHYAEIHEGSCVGATPVPFLEHLKL